MDINTMDQGLLRRNPAMTRQEFSHHWFTKHAALVVPFFLHSGIRHYEQACPSSFSSSSSSSPSSPSPPISQFPNMPTPPPQIHGPLTTNNPALDISTWDGAAGMPAQEFLDNPPPMPKWKEDYYREVILPDERRFLVTEALQHIFRVGPGSVKGERKVVIEEGRCLIEVGEDIWKVWREYEDRGKEEEEEGKDGK